MGAHAVVVRNRAGCRPRPALVGPSRDVDRQCARAVASAPTTWRPRRRRGVRADHVASALVRALRRPVFSALVGVLRADGWRPRLVVSSAPTRALRAGPRRPCRPSPRRRPAADWSSGRGPMIGLSGRRSATWAVTVAGARPWFAAHARRWESELTGAPGGLGCRVARAHVSWATSEADADRRRPRDGLSDRRSTARVVRLRRGFRPRPGGVGRRPRRRFRSGRERPGLRPRGAGRAGRARCRCASA